MKIDVLTLFPEMFSPFEYSILRRAQDKSLVQINLVNLRDFATDKHKTVDDRPYGGGAGMVMRVDIIDKALESLRGEEHKSKSKVILLDARGKKFDQKKATELSSEEHLILICGHYEGVDHRVAEHLCDEIISVGDYVLSGGELPAMTVVDTVVRLIPGVLGNSESLAEESFNNDEVEYPQYTRPEEYRGWKVPEVLLSGDPKKIKEWKGLGKQADQ